jgi:hypothetical protein
MYGLGFVMECSGMPGDVCSRTPGDCRRLRMRPRSLRPESSRARPALCATHGCSGLTDAGAMTLQLISRGAVHAQR